MDIARIKEKALEIIENIQKEEKLVARIKEKALEIIENILLEEGKEDGKEDTEKIDLAELILLTHPECPSCTELRKILKEQIENNVIREVSVTTEEGKKLMKIANEFPALIAKIGDEYVKCTYWFEGEDLKFSCDVKKN